MGAEALEALLSRLDLDELSYSLRHKANTETSQQRKTEALKRTQIKKHPHIVYELSRSRQNIKHRSTTLHSQ